MKNKILMIFLIGIFLFSFVSPIDNQGLGKQNQNFTFVQTCSDSTFITISTIQTPDRVTLVLGQNMTSTGSGSFQFNVTDTSQIGRYDLTGISDGCEETFGVFFDITPSGKISKTGESILYALILLIMFGLDLLIFYIISTLPSKNERDEGGLVVRIVNLKFIRIFLIALSYPLIIITLNLMNGLAVNFVTLSIFSGIIGFLFEVMLRAAWIWTFIMILWILFLLIRDTNLKKMMRGLPINHG